MASQYPSKSPCRKTDLENVVLDEGNAWIKAGVREINLKLFSLAVLVGQKQTMWRRADVLRINRDELLVVPSVFEGDLTERYGNIPRLLRPSLSLCGETNEQC